MKMRLPRLGAGLQGSQLRRVSASVFTKVAGLVIVSTLVVACLLAWQAWRLSDKVTQTGIAGMARQSVNAAAATLLPALRFRDEARTVALLEEQLGSGDADLLGGLVLGADGQILAELGTTSGQQAELVAIAQEALSSGGRAGTAGGYLAAEAVVLQGQDAPLGAVAMAWTDSAMKQVVERDKTVMVATAVGGLVTMLLLVVLWLRRIVLGPLTALQNAMARVAAGDYEVDLPMQSRRDEFGELARHLADLTATLARGREAQEARGRAHEAQNRVVRHLSDALDALAAGSLHHAIAEEFPGEYEELRGNYNRAVESLRATMTEVNSGALNIHSSAEEIARASDDLSRRTETQAATLEETAAALEEMLSRVREAAQSAKDAEGSVQTASKLADQNGEVMRSAIEAMAGIERSSQQINEIIGVIDDIAFQTNLLALNAGVEAARAGASGKGFAVVASEVRALAQRSSDAAQQIKTLISGSADRVRDGVELVERSGEALGEVVAQVSQIATLVGTIAGVAAEQAQGLNEINVGVSNLDRVTQQNAAMVEQSTAAAHMLRGDAGRLSDLMRGFNVGDVAPQQSARATAAA
ncbi:methyl-accepting chemotaxis protein [Salipiger mangrovisoli]|uniref:HAMP domain-containing protein n=1 Tax=Salipiger mangrovisoli TaxID=2865933 RepID=A0ABR9WW32_9RHOB|nr:methyl-accepting chemotaxis protein [Salipiger mangrovisoli]MBE9635462.1 HAMP domain-containing protein [Salipiger mangrovisoli]